MSLVGSEWSTALDAATELAKRFEGCHLSAYFDPVGFPTQGWGRLLSREKWADLSRWPPIDQATADAWLQEDMTKHALTAQRMCNVPLSPFELAALSDFAFNLGPGNLQISTLRRRVNEGDKEGAAEEFGKWIFAGGIKLRGLVRRRAAERDLFLTK
jgi:lysozyme